MDQKSPFRNVKMEEAIQAFRQDPRSYTEFRQRFEKAQSDDERFKMLLDFATEEVDLRQLSTSGSETTALAATVTTVTVTTVFVPSSAY